MGHGIMFASGPAQLYGFVHPAAAPARDLGAVLVHPFMEEKQDSHLVYRDLAERLAARGHPVLRFDLFGHGDSQGSWEEATLARWLDDIQAAREVLRRETGATRLLLHGLRFGGTLAALAARTLAPDALVLWQPVVKGRAYLMDVLRAHLAEEMVLHKRAGISREVLIERLAQGQSINLFGYHLSPAQWDAITAVDLLAAPPAGAGRTLVLDVVRTPTARDTSDLAALAQALGPTAVRRKVVESQSLFAEGKLHTTKSEQAATATLEWLEAG